MRRSLFHSIVFIWVLALAQFLPGAAACAYAQTAVGFEQGLLWRIEKDGAGFVGVQINADAPHRDELEGGAGG